MSKSTLNTAPDSTIPPSIHVAVGVLQNTQGQVLLAQRAAKAHQGGLWEFPGGKLEPGEDVKTALFRELREELGVDLEVARPLIRVSHCYADRKVILDTWLVTRWQGEAYGKEGQPLVWVSPGELNDWDLPAADVPILQALALPDTYLITPPQVENSQGFLQQLEHCLQAGISLVQFRVFGLPPQQLRQLATDAASLCKKYSARMLVNGSLQLASESGAHGVHLDRRKLAMLENRESFSGLLLSASCHNEHELQQAEKLGLDFAVLSPVLPTQSHPDAEVLGWDGFAQLRRQVSLPVYALGGMSADLLSKSWEQGAQGIAGIRGLWPVAT